MSASPDSNNAAEVVQSETRPPSNAELNDSNDTLKYHLLGPSLTKAGQDKVDQQKVSVINRLCSQVYATVTYNFSQRSPKLYTMRQKDLNFSIMRSLAIIY